MGGRWMDEERERRARDWRGDEAYGRDRGYDRGGPGEGDYGAGAPGGDRYEAGRYSEADPRSFSPTTGSYDRFGGGRVSQDAGPRGQRPGLGPVFGQLETGADYVGPRSRGGEREVEARGEYRGGGSRRDEFSRDDYRSHEAEPRDWRDRQDRAGDPPPRRDEAYREVYGYTARERPDYRDYDEAHERREDDREPRYARERSDRAGQDDRAMRDERMHRDERYRRDAYGREGREERGGGRNFLDRAADQVAAWFRPAESDRRDEHEDERRGERRAQGLYRGQGPKDYRRPDERIAEQANERLTDDPWVDASNISVSVSAGEVTLSGTVPEREAKHRAERLVEEISGVNHVQNNLRVARGSFLTSPGRGFGDSVQAAQMAQEDRADPSGSRETNAEVPPPAAGRRTDS